MYSTDYGVDEALKKINKIYSREIINANILEIEVGTTGFCGGDTGHGGRTYFSLKDLSNTDMRVRIKDTLGSDVCEYYDADLIEIAFGGDAELVTFVEALEFAIKKYRDITGGY